MLDLQSERDAVMVGSRLLGIEPLFKGWKTHLNAFASPFWNKDVSCVEAMRLRPDAHAFATERNGGDECLIAIEAENSHPVPRWKLNVYAWLWDTIEEIGFRHFYLVRLDHTGAGVMLVDLCRIAYSPPANHTGAALWWLKAEGLDHSIPLSERFLPSQVLGPHSEEADDEEE